MTLFRKSALITGSSSGIGFAYANYLLEQGWSLDLVSHDRERSEQAEKRLNNPTVKSHLFDLSQPNQIKELIKVIPTPDLLIANAGITKYGLAGSFSSEDKIQMFYLLCGGVIDLIEGYLAEMKKKDASRIIIISSIAALTPMPKSSIYASAKTGIYAYSRSLSKELEKSKLKVTVSLPGYVKTNAHKRAGLDHLEKQIPPWMWISPEQVVKETEIASLKGKTQIIPGIVYRLVRPMLNWSLATRIWNQLSKRK